MKQIAFVGLPFIAAMHHFACELGYRNKTYYAAFQGAWRVAFMVGLIETTMWMLS